MMGLNKTDKTNDAGWRLHLDPIRQTIS